MSHIAGVDSRQMTMSIGCIEDEIPEDSPARFIEVFADSFDLEAMGFEHAVPAATGRPPYSPYLLVKLYIYGYLNRIRSSRRLMRECRRNIELWFLLNRLCPDFRTIADFRRKHRKLLKQISASRRSCPRRQTPAGHRESAPIWKRSSAAPERW